MYPPYIRVPPPLVQFIEQYIPPPFIGSTIADAVFTNRAGCAANPASDALATMETPDYDETPTI